MIEPLFSKISAIFLSFFLYFLINPTKYRIMYTNAASIYQKFAFRVGMNNFNIDTAIYEKQKEITGVGYLK